LHLREIQLENFKSFGKRQTIPLLDGFTAVTGPNGSGKSNISDAVLFVLGPRSSKAIRARNLSDLIYNGGKSKKPARSCKVSLVFDNTDRTIPLDADTIILTRVIRLSKTQEGGYYSYYYINGRPSNLNQFENILAHARISADGYNIVQQGDINQIVSMGPIERRRLIEDMAGITKFDADINKAEKKKAQVEENLDRISVILSEIEIQIKQLEKDREDALKYKELKDKLDLAKAQMAYKQKELVEAEIVSISKDIQGKEEEKASLLIQKDKLLEEKEKIKEELVEVENEILEKGGEEAQKLKGRIDQLRLDIARCDDSTSTAKESIGTLKKSISHLRSDIKGVEKELKRLDTEAEKAQTSFDKKAATLEEVEKKKKETDEYLANSNTQVMEIQRKLMKLQKKMETSQKERHEKELELDRVKEKIESLSIDIARLEEIVKTHDFELKDRTYQLSSTKSDSKETGSNMAQLQKDFMKANATEKKLREQLNDMEARIERLTREHSALKTERSMAEKMEKGYTRAVDSVLDARDRGKLRGIHGTIAELAEVDPNYEKALMVSAGTRMQSLVVEDDESAAAAINYLKQGKLGRATFLPINKMASGKPRAKALMASQDDHAAGFAIDLVQFDEKFRSAFWYVFGDTVVVDNMDTMRKLMGGVRLVTTKGDMAEASGAMIGGSLSPQKLRFGVPSPSEIENAATKLREAMEKADSISNELTEVRNEMVAVEEKIKEGRQSEADGESKYSVLEREIKELESKLKDLNKELKEKTELRESQMSREHELVEGIDEHKASILELEKEQGQTHELLLKATPAAMAKEVERLRKSRESLTIETEKLRSTLETLKENIKLHHDRKGEHEESKKNAEDDIDRQKKRIEDSKVSREKFQTELTALTRVADDMDEEFKKLSEKRDTLRGQIYENENTQNSIDTRVATLDDFTITLRSKQRTVEEQLKEVVEAIKALNVEVDAQLPSMKSLKTTITQCEGGMQELEPVNMRAIDMYDYQQNRQGEIQEDVKRLEEQKQELVNVVDELVTKKKEGLMKVFNGVNVNFKEIYKNLSGGGSAELQLENIENPFEGGLLIHARPPGKKVLRIEALSGGEKGLTSMALIFAFQQFAPSPFYLLDEIDQNLDGINAENVAKMVRQNSASAQFVVVSLRKVTLNQADHVYGVTIQADGITDIIGNVNIADVGDRGELKVKVQPRAREVSGEKKTPTVEPDTGEDSMEPSVESDEPGGDIEANRDNQPGDDIGES